MIDLHNASNDVTFEQETPTPAPIKTINNDHSSFIGYLLFFLLGLWL